jgi:hypothetical protein
MILDCSSQVAKDPLSGDEIPTDAGHLNNSGRFVGRAWRRDVSTLAGIHLSPFGSVAPTPSPARGRITPIEPRASGQGGLRSVSKILFLTQTMFQFLNQLRESRRSRRLGRLY